MLLSKRSLQTIAIILGLMIIGAGIGIYASRYYHVSQPPEFIEGMLWPGPKQIGAFTVVDHEGEAFGINNLKGKWSFLFFGYTQCPDVCPVTMSVMDVVHNRLQQAGLTAEVQTIFITIDPERDTIARLAEYTGFFNDDFHGVGGSHEQVDSLAGQIGIAYSYAPAADDGNYLVAHTSSIFLLDPEVRLVSIFSAPHNADTIESRFLAIETFIRNQDQN